MGQYGTLIQPIGYLLISPPFSFMKMMDKKINDLLSFSVFFLIDELVGLEFHGELEMWNYGFTKGTIQIQSVTVE